MAKNQISCRENESGSYCYDMGPLPQLPTVPHMICFLRSKHPTSQMQKHEAWTLEHGLNERQQLVHKPEGGSAALSTGSSWRPCYGHWLEDVHAFNSCCTCMCTHTHTHMQDLYTQRAIVNSWPGFYCHITPDTQTGEQIMSHGNLDCQTLI